MATKLPLNIAEAEASLLEADMIGVVSRWFDLVSALLQTESSHLYTQAQLKAMIRRGTIPTVTIIGWANDGAADAHAALLQVAAEMIDHGEQLPATIAGYAIQHLGKPPKPRRKGRDAADNLLRDQCIAVLVALAIERWHPQLPMSRNPASDWPSACSLVSSTLQRRGIQVKEKRVEQIFGELADLLPAHRAWQAALLAS
ncbi:hypothetical protein ACVMGC_007944 [Bradyrhizobium barranii subsp. barranii]|uniref:hypothetical protein n=1 Tax=Bradyrhizobium TaxID=374 RepID=UPI0004126A3D|nr:MULTISPECIES: hypothetical protein [Bradyrhizobium]MBR0877761.1 hypothetical protein [Bradyrhizobium liaoningense]MBR0997726.1 hypothetical protein [Bradyrhizobium liaoningense]MBR1066458.1 hypothetical protein [Bradyrhizobium liaoningense]MCP1743589.1 hypothetical protein [Bradyrhizobium japonicum]MCP1781939.1 hypothetical protein [Bradyrhizobium japonicum]